MAKTASQIRAERKAIDDVRNAIHERQMAEVATKNAERTQAVYKKAASVTSDPAKKAHYLKQAYSVKSDITPSKKTDMQKKKEDVAEAALPSEAERKERSSKKAYEDYMASDERKEKQRQKQADLQAEAMLSGNITDAQMPYTPPDETEQRLKDEVDYWEGRVQAEKDAETHDRNMQDIESMGLDDKAAFEKYVRGETYVKPEEIEAYKKLKARYGDRLDLLKETYNREQTSEKARQLEEKTANKVHEGGWIADALRTIGSAPARIIGGITGTAARIDELANRTGQYKTLAQYTQGDLPSVYSQTVQSEVTKDILGGQEINMLDGISAREAGAMAYQAGSSLLDVAAQVATAWFLGPTASMGLVATQTFADSMTEATKQGATPEQAAIMSVGKAGLEAALSKMPLDDLLDIAKKGMKSGGGWKMLKQIFSEITEEELSIFGGIAMEAAVLRDKSAYKQNIGDLVAGGLSYEQAKEQADKAIWNESIQTAAVSGLTALVSAGGMEYVNRRFVGTETPVQQEQAAQTPPAAPVEAEADPAQQVVEAVAAELAQQVPQQEAQPVSPEMAQLDTAIAETLGIQTEAQSAVDTAAPAEYDNNTITVPGAAVGRSGVTYTADNKPVQFQYAVVPAESLITSNDQYGNVNSAYPAELQPRDRTRTASQTQINSISRNLNPALLAESPTAQNGAPIIRGDGVVIGGNGRVSAITQAYGAGRGADYQLFITEKAAELGIDPATLPANPVLVRVTNGVDNYTELANSLNASTTASYSATEAANADASRIGDIIEYLSVGDDGGINTAGNKDFIQKFVAHVVPETERGDVMQANGQLSQAGERRIQNALFAYAYGDTALVERLAESTDNNARNITNAMVAASGKVAQLQTEIARGEVQDLGLQNAITDAVNLYLDAKAGKQTVTDTAGQLTMGDNGPEAQYDGLTVHLAKFLESNSRSGLQIRKFIDILVDVNMNASAETATEVSMFDTGEQQTQEGLYDEAVTAYDQQRDGKGRIPEKSDFSQYRQYEPGKLAGSMGSSSTEGNPGTAVPDGRIPQTVQGNVPGGRRTVTEQVPGVKGTGAAERNFTGKAAYQDLLREGNVQPDRADDVRPMEVPKTDGNGKRVTEFAANAYGAGVTTDEMANTIESLIQDGDLGFNVRTNRESLDNAAAAIQKRGPAATRKQLTNRIDHKKIQDGDIEQGILLYARYAEKGDIDNASEMLVDLAHMANITGRNLQMFKLLRRMTVEGQVMTLEKEVRRTAESMIRSGQVKKGYEPSFDPELMNGYRKALEELRKAKDPKAQEAAKRKVKDAQNAVYAAEAAKMPATFKAKWDAWRYMAMLGNVKTQVRNVAGNLMFKPYKATKDKMAALFEKALPKDQRTKALAKDHDLLKWAKEDAKKNEDVKNALQYSSKLGDDISSQKISEQLQVFDNKALDNVRKFIEKVPLAGDMLFKNDYYAKSLAGFLKARGYTAAQIQSGQIDNAILTEARTYAIDEAMKATFNDSNAFSDAISGIGRGGDDNPWKKALNIAAEGILPFRRTPANIVVRFAEYSPAGLAKGMWDMAAHVKNGDMSAATAIDQITAGLTGTGAMVLGYMMAAGMNGIKLTGSGTDDDEKRQGHQDYALEFSVDGKEYSYKIDWAAPANLPLFVGANIYDAIQNAGGDPDVSKITAVIRGMGTAFEPMLALSCMSSLNDLVEGVRYANEGEALYTIATDVATSYFTQGIPALLRQTYQATQETKQTTFANDSDPTIRDLQKTAATIPFLGDQFQTEKRNAWGETESNGDWMTRAFNSFVNPGTLKEIDNSAVEQEITRLNKAGYSVTPDTAARSISYIDKDGYGHDDVRLTEEQYQTLAQVQGQTDRELVEKMISSKSYAALTDEQKADALDTAYLYARKTGEIAAVDDHTGYDQSWFYDVEKGGAEEIIRRTLNSGLNTSMGDMDTAWDKGYNEETFARNLETAYDSYKKAPSGMKKQVFAEAEGTAKKYIEARDKGLNHTDALAAIENVAKVKGTGSINKDTGKATVRDIDRRQAIANTTGLTEKEIDIVMKAYMADYDPSDESPETTEMKYDYVRYELGMTAKEYASTYRAYLDNSKKAQRIAAIRALGYDYSTALKLYKVYSGSMKKKLIEIYG